MRSLDCTAQSGQSHSQSRDDKRGSLTASLADPRKIFKLALEKPAAPSFYAIITLRETCMPAKVMCN